MDDEFDPPAGDDFNEQDGPGLFEFDDAAPQELSRPPESETPTPSSADQPTEPEASSKGTTASEATAAPAPAQARPAPLALYRRYRPETFDEVIGQEHVTEPLRRALLNNRVNHAYLFSGPRGCGKTTCARILARCLNCEQGPTPTPCGICQSCRDLARGGIGSIDVIEIDAASHGGVDDARDLRERAFFAPMQSRYKIYIVDEAHMVTTAGFNAMLKLVEEPPPHVKFIFATTEPEKVIGTIRSRTHHYPFRLVPPKVLGSYLATLCEAEGVPVEPTVLPLVVRAGAGSVRDSLSVLDQLLGGADENGVSYAQASSLLGYTPDALLDEIVDAFAAGDAGGVMATIDKVIEVGQDPRRFAEDLLRRLRDLVIVAAVPDAVASGLIDVAADQGERLALQARALGPGEITRAAEVIANGLTEMRGTTAPRLYLELMCARVLLPGADVDGRGIHARLDRIERRLNATGVQSVPTQPLPEDGGWPASDREVPLSTPEAPHLAATPQTRNEAPTAQTRNEAPTPITSASGRNDRASGRASSGRGGERGQNRPDASTAESRPSQGTPPAQPERPRPGEPTPIRPVTPARPAGELSVADLRRLWPQVLEKVRERRRFPWMLLSQHAQVLDVRDGVLMLGFSNQGARDNFAAGGSHDVLRDCLIDLIGVDLRIEAITEGSAPSPSPSGAGTWGGATGPAGERPTRSPDDPTSSPDDPTGSPADSGPRETGAPDTPPASPSNSPASPNSPASTSGPASSSSHSSPRGPAWSSNPATARRGARTPASESSPSARDRLRAAQLGPAAESAPIESGHDRSADVPSPVAESVATEAGQVAPGRAGSGPTPLQVVSDDAIDPSDPTFDDPQQSAVELIISGLDAEIIPDDDTT